MTLNPNHHALNPPRAVESSAVAHEMIRFWIADNADHVSLMVGSVEDKSKEPAMWGFILADIAKHVTQCLIQMAPNDKDVTTIMTEIMAGFEERLKNAPVGSGQIEKVPNT